VRVDMSQVPLEHCIVIIVDVSEGFGGWLAMMRLVGDQVRFQVAAKRLGPI